MADDKDLFKEVKEYLQTYNKDNQSAKKLPSGAQPTGWMFCLPPGPKESFNDVYDGIILGDHGAAKDKGKLKHLRVTHIVNCAQGTKFNQINTDENYFSDSGIVFMGIKALDTIMFKMTPHFKPAADFIDEAVRSGGKVYVHCQSGVSRSSSIVLAYLMLKHNMTLMEAVQKIRPKREISPNDGFLKQLCTLNNEIHQGT